jgi:hypothetical protein
MEIAKMSIEEIRENYRIERQKADVIRQQLISDVKERKVKNIVLEDGRTLRLFVNQNEWSGSTLCHYKERSSRRGYQVEDSQLLKITKINYNKVKGELDDVKNNFKIISKYRKMAELATFSNSFIELCLALPKTLEEYVEQGKKTLYDYGITTGCGVDGKVISINRIEKQYRNVAQKIREAIADKKDVGTICSRYNFAGYEMSIEIHNDNGVFRGFLSLEYKNCGNGYYYLLINDDNFIGYDVD